MNITFKSTRYEPDQKLVAETKKKLETFSRFLGKNADSAVIEVELEKAVGNQKQGDIWRAEINVDHEGARYRVESTKTKLDHAVTTVLRDMAHVLGKVHAKENHLFKKGGSMVKSFLRGFKN